MDCVEEGFEAQGGDDDDPSKDLQQTLGLIQPEAVDQAVDIIQAIRREGIGILRAKKVKLTRNEASEFYHDDCDATLSMQNLCGRTCIALLLSGPNVVEQWRKLVGPKDYAERQKDANCLSFIYGVPEDDVKCGLHASKDLNDALFEIRFFFPEMTVDTIPDGTSSSLYLDDNVYPVLTMGLTLLVREDTKDPLRWLGQWLLTNNPNKIS